MPSKNAGTVVYWDSCVFLSYIEGHAERLPMLDAMLAEANAGRIEIRTSVVTLTEVAFVKGSAIRRVRMMRCSTRSRRS